MNYQELKRKLIDTCKFSQGHMAGVPSSSMNVFLSRFDAFSIAENGNVSEGLYTFTPVSQFRSPIHSDTWCIVYNLKCSLFPKRPDLLLAWFVPIENVESDTNGERISYVSFEDFYFVEPRNFVYYTGLSNLDAETPWYVVEEKKPETKDHIDIHRVLKIFKQYNLPIDMLETYEKHIKEIDSVIIAKDKTSFEIKYFRYDNPCPHSIVGSVYFNHAKQPVWEYTQRMHVG